MVYRVPFYRVSLFGFGKYLFPIFFIFLVIISSNLSYSYEPLVGSPLANHEHPRLLLTNSRILQIRNAIISNPFLEKHYQDYVNWAAEQDENSKSNDIDISGHQIFSPAMLDQAFIANIGEIDGIQFPTGWTSERYAQKAFNTLKLKLEQGQDVSFAAALTYDWTYNFISDDERKNVALMLSKARLSHKIFDDLSLENPDYSPSEMTSSKYYESFFPFFLGLALWGDGYVNDLADKAVDNFYSKMLNYGYLDMMAFMGQEGGWNEWIGYASWHPKNHLVNIFAWVTATNENYITGKNVRVKGKVDYSKHLTNYPYFLYYAVDPHEYISEKNSPLSYDEYTFVMNGGASTTDSSLEHGEKIEELRFLPGMLYYVGLPDEGALINNFIDQYNVDWIDYKLNELWAYLGAYNNKKSLNAKKSYWAKNHGTFFARTGFSSPSDTVFTVTDSHFRYAGHQGADDYPGFSLSKYGTLVNIRQVSHRGYGNLEDYPGAFKYNVIDFGVNEKYKQFSDPKDLKAYLNGDASYDLGGIQEVAHSKEDIYYVRTDRTRALPEGYSHTRDYVFLPGISSDYLVIYDRAEYKDKLQWVYHVPWKPEVYGYSNVEDISTGTGESDRMGTRYTGSDIIVKELNGKGGEHDSDDHHPDASYTGGSNAHGVLFAKTLLPRNSNIEVTRVASLDDSVVRRQDRLAIKSHRWQIGVKPAEYTGHTNFLNVMQTGEEGHLQNMDSVDYVSSGSFDGAYINNKVLVLFYKNSGVYGNSFKYNFKGDGNIEHIIVGVNPDSEYKVKNWNTGNTLLVNTLSDVDYWNDERIGVLYFKDYSSGESTYEVVPNGYLSSSTTSSSTTSSSSTSSSTTSSSTTVSSTVSSSTTSFSTTSTVTTSSTTTTLHNNPTDVNDDGTTNSLDVFYCMNHPSSSCDINSDGIIDLIDYYEIAMRICEKEICNNGIDDDCDGMVDNYDLDCQIPGDLSATTIDQTSDVVYCDSSSCSLNDVLNNVKPGQIIKLSGIFNDPIFTAVSGTEDKPITIEGYAVINSYGMKINKDYWYFKDLKFNGQGASKDMMRVTGNHITFDNVELTNSARDLLDITGDYFTLKDSTVHYTYLPGGSDAHCLVLSSSNNAHIENNRIYDCDGDGIQFYASDSTDFSEYSKEAEIIGNVFYNDESYADKSNGIGENAIDLKGLNGATIKDNEMYGFQMKAFVAQKGTSNLVVENNIIHDSYQGMEFRGEGGKSQTGHIIRRNIIYNINDPKYSEYCIKFDGVSDTLVYHNTLDNCGSDSFRFENEGLISGEIYNNLVSDSGSPKGKPGKDVLFGYNGWFNSNYGEMLSEWDVVGEDARFDSGYTLMADSPAIDRGKYISESYYGNAPDLGAYEYRAVN